MKDLIRKLDQNGERWLLLIFYTTIVATITIEVIRRFVLDFSSVWGEEVARYCFIYLAWIGASAAVRERAHLRIDVLIHYMPPRGKAVLFLFGDLVTVVLAVIALYWSIHPIITSIQFGSVTHGLRVSQAWFLFAVPLGFTLMMVRLIQSIARDWVDLRTGRPVFEGNRLFD